MCDAHAETEYHLTRQMFLIQLAFWLGWGSLGLALLKYLELPAYLPADTVELGPPQQFSVGSVTFFALYKAWLVRNTQGFYALQAVCPHLGCQPRWQSQNQTFACPCHGSRFDPEGSLLQGPALRALARLHIFLSPGGQIGLNLQQTYLAEAGEWQAAGAFLAWPEATS